MMSRHADASNPGRTTSEAPSHTSESTGAVPATWKNGPAARKTSDGRSPQAIVLWNELATRLRWVRTTPFGRPVVPLVKYTTATSASETPVPSGAGPAASTTASHSSNDMTRSTSSASGPGSRSVTSSAGRAASMIRASSAGASRMFNGTRTSPAHGTPRYSST